MTSVVQQSPFLRVQRNFPTDNSQALSIEVDRAYCDTAAKVNARTIGLFPVNRPAITGDKWFINSTANGVAQNLQSLRQIYTFTATGNIPHGLNWTSVSQISPHSYGSLTDGTNWYGVLYASSTAIAGQVSFYVTPTNIVVLGGAGAPTITSGTILLEWLSQV